MNIDIAYLPVICISERASVPDQIKVGSTYIIDRLSIWIDQDGNAYGMVYDAYKNPIAQLKLSHFRCR